MRLNWVDFNLGRRTNPVKQLGILAQSVSLLVSKAAKKCLVGSPHPQGPLHPPVAPAMHTGQDGLVVGQVNNTGSPASTNATNIMVTDTGLIN